MPPEPFSLSIRRVHGKVVVTVSGEVEPGGCLLIERALNDLIEGQGNVNVEVDLRAARIDASAWHRRAELVALTIRPRSGRPTPA